MRVVAQGKQMQMFLDDNLIVSVSDSRITQGVLSIGAFPNKILQFDDFKVWQFYKSSAQVYTTADPGSPGWKEGKVLLFDDFESGKADNWKFDGFWKVVQDETGNFVLQREGSQYAEARMVEPVMGELRF